MIIYNGKMKNYNFKVLLYAAYLDKRLSSPIEKLELADFSKN